MVLGFLPNLKPQIFDTNKPMQKPYTTIDKKYILEKLQSLVGLCQRVEPDIPDEKTPLFNGHLIAAQEMYDRVENHYGVDSRFELSNIMLESNKLWRVMRKIDEGDFDAVDELILMEEVEDFISQGQKINAIKHYRSVMKEKFDTEVSLREAKDYVDALHESMRQKGMIPK